MSGKELHLYEMTGEMLEFQKLIDTGELPPEAIADTLEAMQMSFNDKAVNIVKFGQGMEVSVKAIDTEIKRLQDRKRVITNQQERLLDYLRTNMERTDTNKIECPLFNITLVKATMKAEVTDEEALPDEFVEIEVVKKPKMAEILAELKRIHEARQLLKDDPDALAAIEDLPGADLVWSKRGLRIK